MKTLILLAVLLFPVSVLPQEPAKPAVAAAEPATPVAAVEPAVEPAVDKVTVEGDKVTIGEIVTDTAEVVEAVKVYKETKKSKGWSIALMAALAAIFKLLLSAVKLTSDFWKGRKGKTALRLITVGLGALGFLAASVAGGMNWLDALVVGMSGPLAIAFHEYTVLIPVIAKKKEAVKV